jgi:hypothetical protein
MVISKSRITVSNHKAGGDHQLEKIMVREKSRIKVKN